MSHPKKRIGGVVSVRRTALTLAVGVLSAAVLSGCMTPQSYTYSSAERVSLETKPFSGFDDRSESAARTVKYNMLAQPDVTLGDPVLAYQTFAQFEYLANELKTVYVVVTPTMLQDMEDARLAIRSTLRVPPAATVTDTIQNYGSRAKSATNGQKQLVTENKETLKVAMAKAGYAVGRYLSRVESEQNDDNDRRMMN